MLNMPALQATHESIDVALPFAEPRNKRVKAVDHETGEPVDLELSTRFVDALQKLGLLQTLGCLRLARSEVCYRLSSLKRRERCRSLPLDLVCPVGRVGTMQASGLQRRMNQCWMTHRPSPAPSQACI